MSMAALGYVKHLETAPNGEKITTAERALLWFLADEDTGWSGAEASGRMCLHVGVDPMELVGLLEELERKGILYSLRGHSELVGKAYLFADPGLKSQRRADHEIIEIRNYIQEGEADAEERTEIHDLRNMPELVLDADGIAVPTEGGTWFSNDISDLFRRELGRSGDLLYVLLKRGPKGSDELMGDLAGFGIKAKRAGEMLAKAKSAGLMSEVPSSTSGRAFDCVVPEKELLARLREDDEAE